MYIFLYKFITNREAAQNFFKDIIFTKKDVLQRLIVLRAAVKRLLQTKPEFVVKMMLVC